MLKEEPSHVVSKRFGGVPLSALLIGILIGDVVTVILGVAIVFSIYTPITDETVDQMFVIKIAAATSAILVTLFAVVMTIRSQIRQREIMRTIDELYEKTSAISKH